MPLPEPPVVIEFRDGERAVPAHLAANMNLTGVDPLTVTYEEMRDLANKAIMHNYLNGVVERMVSRHFVDNR